MKINFTKFIVSLVILGLIVFLGSQIVSAAAFTLVKDTLNRVKANTASAITHKVIFTTVAVVEGGAGVNKVIMVAPLADNTKWCRTAGTDLTATGCTDESSTSLPGTLTAACTQGNGIDTYDTITVSGVNNLAATIKYCVDIAQAGTPTALLGTDDTAGSHAITIKTNTGAADVDTGDAIIHLVADDQVAVSASVSASLSFSISDTTIGFGTITTDTIRYATGDTNGADSAPVANLPVNLIASTNSTSGLTITVSSANAGLSGPATIAAAASTAVTSTTEGYGVYGKGAASLTIHEGFNNDTISDVAVTTSAQTFASTTGTVNNGDVDLAIKAGISGTTAAGSYSDTLTLICTGNF